MVLKSSKVSDSVGCFVFHFASLRCGLCAPKAARYKSSAVSPSGQSVGKAQRKMREIDVRKNGEIWNSKKFLTFNWFWFTFVECFMSSHSKYISRSSWTTSNNDCRSWRVDAAKLMCRHSPMARQGSKMIHLNKGIHSDLVLLASQVVVFPYMMLGSFKTRVPGLYQAWGWNEN